MSALLIPFLLALPAHAQDALFDPDPPPQSSLRRPGQLGLGLGAGTSTGGLSGKYWLRETMAVQGVIGAGYGSASGTRNSGGGWDTGFGMGADLLFEMPSFAALDDVEFGWSAGPGVGLWATDNQVAVAAAGVIGFEACLLVAPLDVVVEYRPRVLILPNVAWDWFSLSGHIRWYFDLAK